MEAPVPVILRVIAAAGGVACLWPNALAVNFIGLVAVALVVTFNLRTAAIRSRRSRSGATG